MKLDIKCGDINVSCTDEYLDEEIEAMDIDVNSNLEDTIELDLNYGEEDGKEN